MSRRRRCPRYHHHRCSAARFPVPLPRPPPLVFLELSKGKVVQPGGKSSKIVLVVLPGPKVLYKYEGRPDMVVPCEIREDSIIFTSKNSGNKLRYSLRMEGDKRVLYGKREDGGNFSAVLRE